MLLFAGLISLSLLYTRKPTNKGLLWTLSLVTSTFTPVVLLVCAAIIVLGFNLVHPAALLVLSLNFIFLLAIYFKDIANFGLTMRSFAQSLVVGNYFDFSSEAVALKNSSGEVVESKFYLAARLTAPVVFQIHGGGFSHGSLEQINPFNSFLHNLGFHVVVLPYRRIPQVDLPVIIADLKAEIENALQVLKERGYEPEQIHTAGRSAGGYLAMAVANEFPEGFIRKVVSFYPINDFIKIQEHAYAGDILDWPERLEQLFKTEGVTSETLQKYSVGSFSNLRKTQILVFHGDRDPVVDVEQAHALEEVGKKNNLALQVVLLKNQSHAFDVNLNSLASQHCLKKIESFLR